MHGRINESNFVVLLLEKDERALDYVVDTYGGLIRSVVRRHLHSFPDQYDECVNDVLLAVWNQIGHYDPGKNEFSGWLAAVCKYKAIDFKRRYYRYLTDAPLSGEETDPKGNPEEATLAREISEETQSLLQNLSEEDQKLFWDCYVREQPVSLLAEQHHLAVSAVYNHLSRGKKKLRQCREVIK